MDSIASLPLGREFTGLVIKDPFFWLPEAPVEVMYGERRVLLPSLTVGEVAVRIDERPCMPCYIMRGTLHRHRINRFDIDPCGPHLLCFSCYQKDLPEEQRRDYRLQSGIHRHYWEDNKTGYLVQVVELVSEDEINDK